MSENRDREASKLADPRLTETTKALIEIYKSAFGNEWEKIFSETVKVCLG
jgi:hypothetical protein